MTTMTTFAASAALASLLFASPALATDANTVYGKVASGYLLKDAGLVASNQIVFQGGFTHSFSSKLSGDVFVSTGPQGGTAHEVDASLFYDDHIGPVKFELGAQYYAVNLHSSLLKPEDDIVNLSADVSLPHTFGRITVAPVVHVTQMIGVRDLPSSTVIQPGVRLSVKVSHRLSANADVREAFNLTQGSSWLRWSTGLSYQFTEKFSGQLGFEGTSRTPSVVSAGVRYTF